MLVFSFLVIFGGNYHGDSFHQTVKKHEFVVGRLFGSDFSKHPKKRKSKSVNWSVGDFLSTRGTSFVTFGDGGSNKSVIPAHLPAIFPSSSLFFTMDCIE